MISVSELKKVYGSVEALKGISFNIGEGEFYGLLGPNGAGKTTTISIMSAILEPHSGEVSIAGFDLKKNPVACKRNIGVVPQEIALYEEMTGYENLVFWSSLYNVPKQELKARIHETLHLFGLYDRKNHKVKTYSGGMKRRINIATALLHKPKVLFMDEPTAGIDPQSRNLIYEVVEKLHKEGMTIVYTTHYMEEAERLCQRIGIIDDGRIIAQGTMDELRKSCSIRETIVITFAVLTDELYNKVSSGSEDIKRTGDSIQLLTNNSNSDLSKIVLKCSDTGLEILRIDIQKVNLETIFLSLTGKQLRD